jgi:hypothetical protein
MMWSFPTWLWWQRNWALPIFLHLAHGRLPISLRPLVPMPSRSTVSCALASRGLFREDDDQRFSLTPLAEPLRQHASQHCRQALWSGSKAYGRTWGHLACSVG